MSIQKGSKNKAELRPQKAWAFVSFISQEIENSSHLLPASSFLLIASVNSAPNRVCIESRGLGLRFTDLNLASGPPHARLG